VICGKRLEPFYGNAAADYTRVLLSDGNEIKDYSLFSNLAKQGLLGFSSTKTFTSEKREGNPDPRFAWIEKDVQGIQSMGLPNVGIYNYPFEKCTVPTIVSYTGKNKEETKAMTRHVDEKAKKNPNIFAAEFNLTCPNVSGCPSCYVRNDIEHLKTVRENTDLPVIAKIGYFPEGDRLIEFGREAENMGINGIVAINSPPGMGINIETGRSVVSKYGGVFGKGLKPLSLRTVNILHENTNLDLIGLGGVYKYSDVVEFLLAGAKAVEISSRFLSAASDACSEKDVIHSWKQLLGEFRSDTENFMERKGFESLEEIIGKLER